MDRLGWYARRLRSMNMLEVVWRARQAVSGSSRERGGIHREFDWPDSFERFRSAVGRPLLLDSVPAAAIAADRADLVRPLILSADQLVDNRFQFFGYPAIALPRPINWHLDPISNTAWPDLPANKIDHRASGGGVKWIWELNRLQHLPLLAEAWLFTGDERYSRVVFEHLDTWIVQNPPGRGIAWRGAFEAGLRAISIAVALQGLRQAPELTCERYQRIVSVLALSADRCWRERSLFSSANNHLIGEMVGLAVVAMMFPELPQAPRWERNAVRTLSTHADRLILADGCGAEQSIGYQIATVELLQLVAALLMQRDGAAPPVLTAAITRSSAFLAGVVGERDPDPRYGDADQEFAVRLGPEQERTVHEHLGITAALGRARGGTGYLPRTLAEEWYRSMMPAAATLGGTADEVAGSSPRDFVAGDGGLVVLRRGKCRITMDVGPLGYPSIAAHGHADALSVTLSDDGEDLIGDPGTGSYYQYPQWRTVMRGTRAHPTVCVDGENQSVIGGPFLWSRHARTRVHGIDIQAGIVDAEHDGYSRLPGRVFHRRWLVAPPGERTQLVVDLLTGSGVHEVRTTWPLHPSLGAHSLGASHTANRGGVPVLHLLHAGTAPLTVEGSRGDESQNFGWWSDVLESRTPAWWLGAVCRAELPVVMATLISPPDDVVTTGLTVELQGETIDLTWTEGADMRGVTVHTGEAAHVDRRTALLTPDTNRPMLSHSADAASPDRGGDPGRSELRPVSPIYLCGPIAEAGKPAKGGYQSGNLRTIEALQSRGLEVHALPYAQPESSRIGKLVAYATRFSVLALRVAMCKKKSIIHITGLRRIFLYPELVLVYMAKSRKCRVIYDIRDGLELDLIWVKRSAVYRNSFGRILNAVDLVMVEGDAQISFVESFTGKQPVLMPNQIDLSAVPNRRYPIRDSSTPVIAYAGAVKPEKGVAKILEVAEILTAMDLEVIVRIAGAGDEAFIKELRARYAAIRIEWLGAQTSEQVLDLFSTSHFFMFPTWWPGEGQSNALTEAMACGCVPIVSDHGFNAATVGDCGAVLDVGQSAADYASAVERIWQGGWWEDLSHRSAARVQQRFSSVSVIDHLTEHYVELERGVG